MRVSTLTIYNNGVTGMSNLQSNQSKLQSQLSTGRRILSPSDDPIASSRALKVTETDAIVSQFSTNSTSADSALRVSESTMNQLTTLIQNVQQLAINAGNPTQIGTDKAALDNELQGRYQELLALANQTDGNGLYLFSGYQGNTKPFTETSFGQVTYNGDDGQRLIQISASRNLPVSEPGSDVFQRIKDGNATFTTSYNAANTGSGIVSPGEVVDPTKWKNAANMQDFNIAFNVIPDPTDPTKTITNYDIIDNRATLPGTATANPNYKKSMIDSYDYNGGPRPVVAGVNSYPRTYVPGGDIQFKQLAGEATPLIPGWDFGVKTNVTGTPKTGDTFNLKASQNVDLFSTFAQFSSALKNYTTDSVGNGQADFQNQLNTVVSNLANALSNVLTRQSYQGSRMNEIDSVKTTNDDLNLQYSKTLSGLQDLDYTKAISDFSQNQTLLQAAQQSFAAVQGLSLFKYI
ncbi:flagellar hook-associated protein 3 FlgL [Andreprevotia lacus DSM 23236]|jgi:flagellar hook-associated protein 3 FlgL|uniref:Flagellar hook-associated protein 3 FlgL n=1 Tax=Andreprevotia lacus DSM 23236 TaxID=1121001 RepID=A0A1W1WYY0_9NEIS|nr:flagellar hook-associated protein FlgL [Andreprevotia lacus]SMC16865.1 flagellar hook-associated protein 3 FlgL [Andreprevotia lacus DSM 23236]